MNGRIWQEKKVLKHHQIKLLLVLSNSQVNVVHLWNTTTSIWCPSDLIQELRRLLKFLITPMVIAGICWISFQSPYCLYIYRRMNGLWPSRWFFFNVDPVDAYSIHPAQNCIPTRGTQARRGVRAGNVRKALIVVIKGRFTLYVTSSFHVTATWSQITTQFTFYVSVAASSENKEFPIKECRNFQGRNFPWLLFCWARKRKEKKNKEMWVREMIREEGCRWILYTISWVRKSRYWGEMLLSPIRCCYVTKLPLLGQWWTMYFTLAL